jgi:GDPmannose 4,6-dehydratase
MNYSTFIFGAGGQDGSLLVDKFLRDGTNLAIFLGENGLNPDVAHRLRVNHAISKRNISLHETKKIDSTEFIKLLLTHQPESLYYLASKEQQGNRELRLANSNLQNYINYELPKMLIELVAKYSKKTKFIYAGSSRMYLGHQGYCVVDEDTKVYPTDIYARAKSKTIELLEQMNQRNEINHCSVVLFNHDSARRKKGYLSYDIVDQFIERILYKKSDPINLFNSQIELDWLSAHDVVEALFQLRNTKAHGKFVIGSGKLTKINSVVQSINSFYGTKFEVVDHNMENQRNFLVSKIDKVKNVMNWSPREDIQDVLIKMIQAKIDSIGR